MSSAQQGIGGLHVSSSSSGGPGAPVTLQSAYDNGQSIDTAALGPVLLSGADNVLVQATLATTVPSGGQSVFHALLDDITGSVAAYQATGADPTTAPSIPLVRLLDSLSQMWLLLTGQVLTFASGDGTDTSRAVVESSDARPLTVRGGRGLVGGVGLDAPPVDIGISNGSGYGPLEMISGGLRIEGNGRITLRKNDTGALAGEDPRGTLRLHNVTAAEDVTTPEEGDLFLRTEDGAGPAREKGFRAYREAAYGLVARVYQRTFTDADLADRILTVQHDLETFGVVVAVYDENGINLPSSSTTWFAADDGSGNATTLTIDTALVPISGQWRVTIVGV